MTKKVTRPASSRAAVPSPGRVKKSRGKRPRNMQRPLNALNSMARENQFLRDTIKKLESTIDTLTAQVASLTAQVGQLAEQVKALTTPKVIEMPQAESEEQDVA